MKNVLKISLFVFVLNLGLISCTKEDIYAETALETIATDPHNKDSDPPIDEEPH